jgi:hypothetical protein
MTHPTFRRATAIGLALATCLATGAATAAPKCIAKAGTASGPTRDFAEYEALLIIMQVTGNWPFESDRITDVKYSCKQAAGWTCVAHAKVCKG